MVAKWGCVLLRKAATTCRGPVASIIVSQLHVALAAVSALQSADDAPQNAMQWEWGSHAAEVFAVAVKDRPAVPNWGVPME